MADERPAGLRYSERMLWESADEGTRALLARIARLRSGLTDEWQEVAKEAQARVAELEALERAVQAVDDYWRTADILPPAGTPWGAVRAALRTGVCEDCNGTGESEECNPLDSTDWFMSPCVECDGTGRIEKKGKGQD